MNHHDFNRTVCACKVLQAAANRWCVRDRFNSQCGALVMSLKTFNCEAANVAHLEPAVAHQEKTCSILDFLAAL
jgi:hypothetical protein